MELVIMAGGLGSRFGGLKQVEPIDENGNFLIDYSVYDAIRCGFDKVVFVINKDNLEIFENTIAKRIRPFIKVAYAFQPQLVEGRTKPLGTGQAVLVAKDEVSEKFAVINADDFYGYDSMRVAKDSLSSVDSNTYSLISFSAKNTLSENGSVKRGVLELDGNNLKSITESKLSFDGEKLLAEKLDSNDSHEISPDCPVSMNFWGFHKSVFDILEAELKEFLSDEKLRATGELLLPEVIENYVKENKIDVSVFSTTSKWIGMTYASDKEKVTQQIQELIKSGDYPKNLWEK